MGIGAAIVRRLVREGARVCVLDRDAAATTALCAETGSQSLVLDVTRTREVTDAVRAAGPLHILVNNAGIDQHAFFTHTTEEDWQALLAVNLQSVFTTTHAALPAMQLQGYGRIVNIGSEAGRLGSKGAAVYAAAKGGVLAFTRSIARENGRQGITANVVAPGPVDTPLTRKALAQGGQKLLEAMQGATLVGRLGTAEEVAAAVAFLASREAGFITGEVLGVSGGMGCGA